MVFKILKAVIPQNSEPLQDLHNILFHWNCVDRRVLHTSAVEEPGVPVALLPFVLKHVVPGDTTDPDFQLISSANNMFIKIYTTFEEMMRDLDRYAMPENITAKNEGDPLVQTAKEFAMAYVRFTHSNPEIVRAVVSQIVPALQNFSEETRSESIRIYLRIRALFYGLHGFSLTQEILTELTNFNQDTQALEMQAMSLRLSEE